MILFTKARRACSRPAANSGCQLATPVLLGARVGAWPWAADDAFSDWDADRYIRMLEEITDVRGCLFVTMPDIVANSTSTDHRFRCGKTVRFANQPIAMSPRTGDTGADPVGQDRRALHRR